MAAGLAVVATDCPVGGPRSMIDPEVHGLLVPVEDEAGLAEAMVRLMTSPDLRRRLGGRARQRAGDFALPRVMARWTALVEQAATARS